MISEEIDRFLTWLRAAQNNMEAATTEDQWCNAATQDILHEVELEIPGQQRPAHTGQSKP